MKDIFFKYILPCIFFIPLYLLGKTLRVRTINRDVEKELEKKGQTRIYTFWHGRMLYFPYMYRFTGICTILTSPSRDGELVAGASKLFGFPNISGSSFKKGGTALLKLVRTVKKGQSVAIIGDGSRGPLHKVQKGILNLASLTGVPVLPVCYGAKNKIELKSWDRFIIPLPFSRVKVMYGDPVYVDKKTSGENIQNKLIELEIKLNKITEEVDRWD